MDVSHEDTSWLKLVAELKAAKKGSVQEKKEKDNNHTDPHGLTEIERRDFGRVP